MKWLGCLLFICPSLAAATPPAGFPFSDEALSYSIVWPSGLSLGEARLSAMHLGPDWKYELHLEAAVPGYPVKDDYSALASTNLCSIEFDRETLHGIKKANEKTSIAKGIAVRKTVGGGQSEIAMPTCGHDALSFLFFARRELGQGRVPQAEKILFGGAYQLHLKYTGAQNIPVNNVATQVDRVFCTVIVRETQKYEFEVFFARDAARTPVLIRVPFPLGAISMELVR
jgi:hypothetical protein